MSHPDDEITIAPILSRFARGGAEITLVFATSGDAGPGLSGLDKGEELAGLREKEARCAAFALGLSEPVFWRLGDGTLSDTPRAPESPFRALVGRIDEAIGQFKPKIVMTWGPDGGYGHGDHRMTSNAAAQVIQGMDRESRPDLLFSAFPAADRSALPQFENWATTHPSAVTDKIAYEPQDLEATRNALQCYKSQFPAEARAGLTDLLHNTAWRGSIWFRLAFPTPMRPPARP